MRKILLAGNWKMNGDKAMIDRLLKDLLTGLAGPERVEMAVFPPFPYLQHTQKILQGTSIAWGGQTLNPAAQGAHTGEVCASMLRDFGCRYVLVGHSERRTLHGESDTEVALRFEAAQKGGLEPVLCVGETLAERERGETRQVVTRQVNAVLDRCGIDSFAAATIAYEPVWAIGSGKTASPDQAQEIHEFIRDKLRVRDDTIAAQIRILYGGSVNGGNAADLFARKDIDGGLVGGASLKAEDFLAIRDAAVRDFPGWMG